MKRIGLIGGMSWESTAVYYRQINTLVRARLGGLHSADILLQSLDFAVLVDLQKRGDWAAAATMLADAAQWLVQGGAEGVLICTNTMHLVAEPVAARIAAIRPQACLIDIIDETAIKLRAHGWHRPLLLATRYTMEHGFYAQHMARHGIAVMTPAEAHRNVIHDVIFDELCQGVVLECSHARLLDIIAQGMAAGADCVIFGCTEICLLLDPASMPCPALDSTAIHVEAAVRFALEQAKQAVLF